MKKVAFLVLAAALGGCRRPAAPVSGSVRDVVLVTIDTLRADAPGYAGDARVSTPQLDRIAREGRIFTRAHAQNVITLPSHVNILTGLYPFQHGVRDNDGFRLDPKIPTLATFLKARGYATAAFIGAFPLDARFGLAKDFDVYDQHYPEGVGPYDFVMSERPASEVVAAARKWWEAPASAPRFLWVHLYDCHAPYRPPPPFDREYAANPYLGEVAGVDAALGPLFDELRSAKAPPLVVVTGDHGEALGDHGELTHGLFAYEATLHVPLLVWSPGAVAPGTDARLARHVDIVPTVLEAVGAKKPAGLPGESLLGGPPDSSATSYFEALSSNLNRGWAPLRGEIGRNAKYIDLPIPELYALDADPGEKQNLFSADDARVRVLKNAIPRDAGNVAARSVSSEERARLQSLGYLSGSAATKAHYGPEDDPKNLVALDQSIHELVDLYQRGRIDDALRRAADVVKARPSMRTGYDFLAFLQAQAGNDAAAIATLEAADRRGLIDDPLRSRWGLLCAESGRASDALRVLAPLSTSRDPDALNAIGIALATAGRTKEAIAKFEDAAAADPRSGQPWQNIGITRLQAGDVPAALDAFGRALALNDRLPRAWNAQGVALMRSGRPPDAIASWKKAVALDRNQFDALFNIALVAHGIGDDADSRGALEEFIARAPAARYGPDIARARQLLAQLRENKG
ncbi:MAG TPA: sulfatase-like hydrolase/transferase [Thermoanaerobaculia bacterium]|nr:sulfatase-like hydrolase/transferase [Thermoanaerobaculia bacterium]